MVDFPGYSLSGVVASFFFTLFSMRQPDNWTVIGPEHPILARIGEDVLLTCQLLPKRPVMPMKVIWYRSEPNTPVFALWDGADVTEMQMEEYRERVEWIKDDIPEGSVALKINNVRPSDNGQYWCRFQEDNYCRETSLLLKVAGVGSSPYIHVKGPLESGIQLVCTAKGWFPEPQVYWEDTTGKKLLSVSEHSIQDDNGLFYVEATLVVKNASLETVSCFIHNPILNEEKSSFISIPASLKAIGPSQLIFVRVGEDIQLTCYLYPKTNAQSMEVRWVQSHHYPAVYVYADREHVTEEQMAEYRGRTVLVSDAINEGKLTLQIHNATTSDNGQYQCLFEKDDVYQKASLDLKIVVNGHITTWQTLEVLFLDLYSSPRITIIGQKDGEIELMCDSEGWLPQPHVQWKDMEGKTIPSFSEVLTQGSHGLFHVKTSLLVTNSFIVSVTCSISNPLLGEEKMATFSLSEPMMTFSWTMVLIWGLFLAVPVGLVMRKSYKKVNMTLDPNTAHSKMAVPEEYKHVTHEYSWSYTYHRYLTVCPKCQAKLVSGKSY